jgi:hypothetical protein
MKRSTLKRSGGARHNAVGVADVEKTREELDAEERQRQLDKARFEEDYNNRTNDLRSKNPGLAIFEKAAAAEKKQAELNAAPRPTKKVQVGPAQIVNGPNTNNPYNISDVNVFETIHGGGRLSNLFGCRGTECKSKVAPAEEEIITPSSSPKPSRKSGSRASGSSASGSRASGSRVAPMPQDVVVDAALEEAKLVKTQQQKAMAVAMTAFAKRNASVKEIGSRLERRDSPGTEAAFKRELAALGTPPRSRPQTNRKIVKSGVPLQNGIGKMSLEELAKLHKILNEIDALDNAGILAFAKKIEGMKGKTFYDDIKKPINTLIEHIEDDLGSANKAPLYKALKLLILKTIQQNFINTHKTSA